MPAIRVCSICSSLSKTVNLTYELGWNLARKHNLTPSEELDTAFFECLLGQYLDDARGANLPTPGRSRIVVHGQMQVGSIHRMDTLG